MGEVYRARDARLGRDVAVKILPGHLASDPEARARFEREARAISRLQHPNICALYDVGLEGDTAYLVMELLDGETLARRLERGPLSSEETLRYGAQVANALAHAHEQGVIHRDLKASNVIVTPDGRARVLDFGLATLGGHGTGSLGAALGDTVTVAGSIVGTPHYLAPEILRGASADARSDIWTLGALLHEMVSGSRPFAGSTGPELAAAILHESPAVLPTRVPPGLRSVIVRCLAKDPAQRFRSAAEVRAALEALQSGSADSVPPPRREPMRFWGRRAILGLIGLLLFARFVWLATRHYERYPEVKQRQLTSNPAENIVTFGAISPDGKTLAVVDQKGLWLRSIESGESRPIPLPEGLTAEGVIFPVVSWDHDGSRFLLSGITADRTPVEWSVPVLGGRAHKILSGAGMATLSPDGKHIAYVRPGAGGDEIWYAGPDGEDPRRVAASDTSGLILTWASWAPGGRRLAYGRFVSRPQGATISIETCDLEGHRRLAFADSPAQRMHAYAISCWLPDGRMVFALREPASSQTDMNLWSLHVDPKSGAPSGAPRRMTEWQGLSLVYPTSVSADGKRLGVSAIRYQSDVYVGKVAEPDSMLKEVRRLTLDDRFDVQPTWTTDGKAVLFASDRNGTYDVFRQPLGAADAEPLVTGPGDQMGPRTSPDGAWILYKESTSGVAGAGPRARLMRIPAAGGAPEKVMEMQPTASFRVARNGNHLCVIQELRRVGHAVFTSFDPIRGRGRELANVEIATDQPPTWDLAPDGSAMAVLVPSDSLARIDVLPLPTGKRETVQVRSAFGIASLAWTADGKGWIAVGASQDEGWRLLRIGRDGSVSLLTPQQMWMYTAEDSPDGRFVAFTSNTGQGNVWMLENF